MVTKQSVLFWYCLLSSLSAPVSLSAWVTGSLPWRTRLGQGATSTAREMVFGDWFKMPSPNKKPDASPTKVPELKKDADEQPKLETKTVAVMVEEKKEEETAQKSEIPATSTTTATTASNEPPSDSVIVEGAGGEEEKVQQGVCRWFNSRLGFGFIDAVVLAEDGQPTNTEFLAAAPKNETGYFVHQSSIEVNGFRRLKNGQKVTFVPVRDDQGRWRAGSVRPVEVNPKDRKEGTGEVEKGVSSPSS